MPVFLHTARSAPIERHESGGVTIGLFNNMPDAACEGTERQFLDLLATAAPEIDVHVKLFALASVPRADEVRKALAARYRDAAELAHARLDGLIVTGTEPRAAKLSEEPYWSDMTALVDWARDNTASAVWSCLAAHAAVLHADGIERRPLADKTFGVFACETIAKHPLLAGITELCVPHSRLNGLPAAALAQRGYSLLSQSLEAGVDAFAREEAGGSLFVFFQGHPEYAADSLLREYRRDIGRYLRGEREHYPAAPRHYFTRDANALLNIFRARAIADRRAETIADFPMTALEAGLTCRWRRAAVGMYRNWIDYLKHRKAARLRATPSLRRRHRDAARADLAAGG